MSASTDVLISISRPDGYEDTNAALVLEDFLASPTAPEWAPRVVDNRVAELEATLYDLLQWRARTGAPRGISLVGLGGVSDTAIDTARAETERVWSHAAKVAGAQKVRG